ncbi:MAG: TIGR04133 family radical SAM/SPASM protein [Rikenellaceae bacterium]|nr:TIGR04133 family radical SAM/SPASM protein [Rikenellaceae bacterium]
MTFCRPSLRKRLGLKLFADLYKDRVAAHRLTTLFWECTLRCNLNCRHCGSDCTADARQKDMPMVDFLRVLDEEITPHVDPRTVLIILSGGEVLVRDDIEQIGLELKRRGYPWGMVTNGLALTPELLERLIAAGLKSVSVSFDGFEEEHQFIRRNPRSYRAALQAIHAILQHPEVAFDIVTCVTPALVPKLELFKQHLIEQGVKEWRIFSIFPAGRAKKDYALELSPEELKEVLEFIRRTRKEQKKERKIDLSYACEGFLGNYESEVRDHFYQCAAGISVASVRVDGAISGCTSIRANYHQGNIYEDHFWEVWENRFTPFRDRTWARKGACATCDMFRYCQGGGMHLRDNDGELMYCHYQKLLEAK